MILSRAPFTVGREKMEETDFSYRNVYGTEEF